MKYEERKYPSYFLPILVLALALVLAWFWYANYSKPTKYIAYIGRFTDYKNPNLNSDFNQLHQDILEQKLLELNSKFPKVNFELKVFDCQANPTKSKEIYAEIAKNPEIIATIDNSWGVDIEGAVSEISKNNLPVVAINADRNGHDYGNAAVFTENNDLLPYDLVAFCKKVLKTDTINFVTEQSYKLNEVFLKAFSENGIVINQNFEIHDAEHFSPQDSITFFDEMKDYYTSHPEDNKITIINTHSRFGNIIIDFFDKNLKNKKLLGHAYITTLKNNLNFGSQSNNELILLSDPNDAVSREVYAFQEQLFATTPSYKERKNTDFFIRRCLNALDIIFHDFDKTADTLDRLDSKVISEKFATFRNHRIASESEIFEINENLEVQHDPSISYLKNGETFSYHQQLNLKKEVIPDLLFGMDIQDIFEVDLNSNSFTADFYYWVKSDSSIRKAEKFILFQNMKQSESSLDLIQHKEVDGVIYKLFKVSGKFYVDYDESHYPFDQQELGITVQILAPSDKMKVSFDRESFIQDQRKIENFTISSWDKKKYYVTVDNHISTNIRGDIENKQGVMNKFKTITFRLDIERRMWSGLLQIVLPLCFIGLLSIALLYVKNMSFENLGEASVGTFLSIIAFSISLSDISPSSDLITRADMVFLLTFVTVFASFMIIIILNSIYDESDIIGKENKNVNRIRLAITILYPILFVWFLVF